MWLVVAHVIFSIQQKEGIEKAMKQLVLLLNKIIVGKVDDDLAAFLPLRRNKGEHTTYH